MKNLVVIGYGGMGGGFHVKHALEDGVVNLLGIYDTDPEKQKKAAANGIYSYSSLDEVLADGRVDICTVAIPNDSHLETVVKCLEAGKNVICEKPVALSCGDLQKMFDAADKSGKLFSVHQNRRWDVDYLAMREIYNSGAVGEVFDIESRIHGSRGIPSDWRCLEAHGGGMILDWGVHLIDQMLQIVPEKIKSVYCELDNITTDEVDDGFKLHLLFENGCRAHIEVGTYNFISMPRFYMRGKKGSAVITDWRENAKIVECTHWHESEVLPVEHAAGLTKTMAPRDGLTTETYEWTRPVADVYDYYRNFVRAIDGEEELIVTHPQMMRVMRVMEAAFESGKKNKVIDFE